ncbi:RHS repeat-associated core domain-containing protein [Kibdelosporangium aridum]|uniref:Intein N-terminal splicing region/RHS repeat-associated core domain-containing protein n=1 Tax=Kibdelosporangium aridum TaxID=2030 RepID=A0A1Y5YCX9_KIBAR|nr:RHS repeat-associated core domain-containing protein [Kibdelosporangium aridum]SMD27631.1 intein N-terminal splicing region/RHS repeat-associated core domain-containing protein [Kibdelosporangium aridum]
MRKHRAFAVAMAIALSLDICVAVAVPMVASAQTGPSVPLPNTDSVPVNQQSMSGRGQDDASKDALKGNQSSSPAGKAGSGTSTVTSLSPSAIWDVSPHTGDFSWSYPMRVPQVPGGLAPSIALSYTSSTVDGLTSATNNQASWVGDGWSLWPGFIERTYGGCAEDLPGDPKNNPSDLCWRSDNATMSMSGAGGRLIRNDADGVWRQERDNGSKVQRLTGKLNGDNDGEYWKITNVDGTQYFFGSRPESNSTWTVPVFGDDAGEPCHNSAGFDASSCVQGYRWNLDKVVDPRGNVVLHQYKTEENHYGRNKNKSAAKYVRDGWLSQIDYGLKSDDPAQATARVVFTEQDRCVPGSDCTFSHPNNLPDVPLYMKCDGGTCPDKPSPSFWTSKRLSKVTTQVKADTGYTDVDSWTLRHEFPNPGDGDKPAMWLAGVTQAGHVGAQISLPEVKFEGIQKPNRVSNGDSYSNLTRYRMNAIVSEAGGVTSIKYADTQCTVAGLPDHPENNTQRCFPVRWAAPGSPEGIDYFHKYVVESVTDHDRLGTHVGVITRYDYLDGAAWHYDKSEILKEDKRTWNEFRGFGHVRVTKGTGHDGPQQKIEHRLYRGMHGDKLRSGTRAVSIKDSENAERVDEDWLSGMTRETVTYDGDKVVTKTINEPGWRGPTATRGPFKAYQTFIGSVDTYTSLASGGRRATRTETTYNDDGQPVTVNDLGDTGTAADDKCSTTSYARNTETWMVSYPSRVEVVAVACGTKPVYPDHTIGDVRTSYDGRAPGEPPVTGNVTRMDTIEGYSFRGPVYVPLSTSKYDGYGRIVEKADVYGHTSKTTYTPEVGRPTQVVTTDPAGNKTTTTLHAVTGNVLKVVDPNDNVAESAYDALGRLTEVWHPNRERASSPGNAQYSYLISQDKPSAVTTKSVNASGHYTTTTTIYDGLLRPRQIQTPAPDGGRLLTDTRYDSVGRAYKTTLPYFNNAAVDTDLWSATDAEIPGLTLTAYDGAGRPVTQTFKGVAREWSTTTWYGGDRVKVTPPPGGTPTTKVIDARGRTVELHQHKSDSEFDVTRYAHDPEGRLTTMTDPAGNTWRYTYDLRGRKIKEEDPDRGTTITTYDLAGKVLTTTDARSVTRAYAYDVLDRPTATHLGSLSGPKLTEFTYDTAEWGIGKLATETRWIDGNAYTHKIKTYDALYNPLESVITIPAAEKGLAGEYKTSADYAPDGSLKSTTMPAIGGLKTEQVTHAFNPLGLPSTSYGGVSGVGTFEYATDTIYTKYGEAQRIQLGEQPKRAWMSLYYEDDTRRLKRAIIDAERPQPKISDVNYTRDPAGRITSITDTQPSGNPDRQCFNYDHLQRLTEAWTPIDECSPEPTPALGGPAPYWHSFTYDKIGNRLTETQHATAGDTVRTYNYPPSGRKLESVTTAGGPGGTTVEEAGYDAAGNTIRRKIFSGEQELDWDAEGNLIKVTEGDKTTEFLYGANGARLIRRDPTGSTLYLPGQEVRLDKAGTKTATRYYNHGGSVIAMRTETGLTWLIGDHQGTAQIAIDAQSMAVTSRRQTPFGGPRGQSSLFPGERGFVGGTIDASIGLITLGARQYDPATGRFISVDPIINPQDPQQWHGYAYANNNPITFSDPSGEYCDGCDFQDWKDGTGSYSDWNSPPGSPTAPTSLSNEAEKRDVRTGKNSDPKKQPVIGGKRVPLFSELKARRLMGHGYADDEYDLAIVDWAQKTCNSTSEAGSEFCAEASSAGLLDVRNSELRDFLFGLTPMSTVVEIGKCVQGSGSCAEAALDAFPLTKAAKVFGDALSVFKKGCSFAADTLVLMADGAYKPIEELQVGDIVLASDPETGETGPRVVTAVMAHDDTVLELATADGATVTTTEDHPFYNATDRAWQRADQLDPGDSLLTPSSAYVHVAGLLPNVGHVTLAYNLTVEGLHTFYVRLGDAHVTYDVLVHNDCGKPVNLPAWRKVDVDMEHVVDRHTAGGRTYQQSGIKTKFPDYMSKGEIESTIRQAYRNSAVAGPSQGERVFLRGSANGLEVEMWVNKGTGTIETAYPVWR